MPDPTHPAPALARISSDASCLRQALRALPAEQGASTLAARLTDAQDLAGTALRLFLALSRQRSRPTDLLMLHRVAQIAKAAQDATAELTAALARAVENQRRQADATSRRVVLIGPTPQQFIESAADLLDRIPAPCDAISRDRPESPATDVTAALPAHPPFPYIQDRPFQISPDFAPSPSAREFSPARSLPCQPREFSPGSTTRFSPTPDGNPKRFMHTLTAWKRR